MTVKDGGIHFTRLRSRLHWALILRVNVEDLTIISQYQSSTFQSLHIESGGIFLESKREY